MLICWEEVCADVDEDDISDMQGSSTSSSVPKYVAAGLIVKKRDASLILFGSTFHSPLPHPAYSHQPHRQNSSNTLPNTHRIQCAALLSYSMEAWAVYSGGHLKGHENMRWQVFKTETSEMECCKNRGYHA